MTNSFNASLTVIDSNISGFGYTATWPGDTGGAGIYVNTQAKVTITGTILRYNGYGIRVAGGAQAVVSRVQAIMNGVGVAAIGPATDTTATSTSLSVTDSLATQCYMGFGAIGRTYCSSCSASVQVSNSIASQNVYGINTEAPGATLYASGNRIDKNSIGMSQFSTATFNSAGNNVTINNSTNTANTITSVAGSVFH
jgi:hypothetical protein